MKCQCHGLGVRLLPPRQLMHRTTTPVRHKVAWMSHPSTSLLRYSNGAMQRSFSVASVRL